MPLWEHLDELRSAVIRILVVLGIVSTACFNYAEPIVRFLEKPLLDALPEGEKQLYFTGIADKFMMYFKVSLLFAVAVCSPYLLFELWRFVAPALYRHEKKVVLPFLVLGTVSFIAGLAFGYFVVLPYSYQFLINFGSPTDKALITLADYFSLTTKMLLGLGLIFELPVVLMLLASLGIVTPELLVKNRKYAFVGTAVAAAVITPSPDAFTMLIVAAPLYLLYEASVLGVRLVSRWSGSPAPEEPEGA